MEWISVEDRLPEDGQVVLAYDGEIKIARFHKGISQEERKKMREGKLPNPDVEYEDLSKGICTTKRSNIYLAGDEFANNSVPYSWESPDCIYQWVGLEFYYWMPIPKPPKEEE
ncbi:DUF551 domain-containing protein [uncultured Subdoligranulum sp.]|uniref:DUF551 domain-containing protein n=1 Tax=uncultured Subdoligranulum sp. TaxID=512298 RepID=UPI002631CCEF|nr:DUF551 domain-containing protein [uncultured Subdoligranulum sp.]